MEYDLVCCNSLHDGDKIFIYRREIFEQFHLPEDLRGCEHVFLYEVSRKWHYLMINEALSIIHRQSDNLSNANNLIARSLDIAKSYERVIQNHNNILRNEPIVVAKYLKKALYRYGVAGSRKDVLRIYLFIIRHLLSLQNLVEATGLLLLSMIGPAPFERWRINQINKNLTRR